MKATKHLCPKCNGEAFKLYSILVYLEDQPFMATIYECANCGWRSRPTDPEEIKKIRLYYSDPKRYSEYREIVGEHRFKTEVVEL